MRYSALFYTCFLLFLILFNVLPIITLLFLLSFSKICGIIIDYSACKLGAQFSLWMLSFLNGTWFGAILLYLSEELFDDFALRKLFYRRSLLPMNEAFFDLFFHYKQGISFK